MKNAMLAVGVLMSTLVVPVLAIVLIVWFVTSLVRHTPLPWEFWAGAAVGLVLLQVLASGITRWAENAGKKR